MKSEFSFIIYATNGGMFIAKGIKKMLKKINIKSIVVNNISQEDINNNYHHPNEFFFIIFPHTLKLFPIPKKYIIYQLEQVKQSNWITDLYKERMENSLFTFDYSLENYRNFSQNLQNRIYYLPIPMKNKFNSITQNIEYDLLLFGGANTRRNNIVNYLSKKYKILFVTSSYGDKLIEVIQKSKIILNIHFYKNAILETCRLNETLCNNKLIISEEPDPEDWLNKSIYTNNVIFIEEIKDDLSNIQKLDNLIGYYLDQNNSFEIIKKHEKFIKKLNKFSFYFFKKAFNDNHLANQTINIIPFVQKKIKYFNQYKYGK